ncbi:MAG: hypothetical protein CMJ83_10385 [Planctomycetes bacterium]|nr:hypothetical protein [Planctomycetota bacterium]
MKVRNLSVLVLLAVATMAPAQVVINEFDCGGADAIELRNLGSSPAAIGGMVIQTWYATGTALIVEPSFTIPGGITIPAGGTWLFQENGTAGANGTVPGCSTRAGFNWLWTDTRAVVIRLMNGATGVDYVFRNNTGVAGVAPNLPAGTTWTGSFGASGNICARNGDVDTNSGADWTTSSPFTPCALNPGQQMASPVGFTITTSGGGQVSVAIDTTPPLPGRETYGLYSSQDFTPNGSGPFFGIGTDAISWLFLPAIPNSPFHSNLDGSGQINVSYPAGTIPPGAHIEGVLLVIDGGSILASNVAEQNF